MMYPCTKAPRAFTASEAISSKKSIMDQLVIILSAMLAWQVSTPALFSTSLDFFLKLRAQRIHGRKAVSPCVRPAGI